MDKLETRILNVFMQIDCIKGLREDRLHCVCLLFLSFSLWRGLEKEFVRVIRACLPLSQISTWLVLGRGSWLVV